MDMGFVAATMARARADDAGRYDGCVMFSALPDAPVVEHRRGVVRWLRDGTAALRARGRTDGADCPPDAAWGSPDTNVVAVSSREGGREG